MSEKLRSVNTKFWDDPFIEDLPPTEKLLFLYLLTNPLANLLGIYEITVKRISYDTGLSREAVLSGLKKFEVAKKAFFVDNFILLPNWLKNQRLNSNMKVSVAKEFNDLPKSLKTNLLSNGSESLPNGSESFRIITECLDKYEVEDEDESEEEIEDKKKIEFSLFWDTYHKITGLKKTDQEAALKYWNRLKKSEQEKALLNCEPYWKSLSDKKYCKKARTYLADKNFNDELPTIPTTTKPEQITNDNSYQRNPNWPDDGNGI